MTDQEAYKIVHDALFQTGSCLHNIWYTIVINGKPMFEAKINEKNYIHLRKPIKKADWYENRNDVYLYQTYRFTYTKKLVPAEMTEGIKPNPEHRKEIAV